MTNYHDANSLQPLLKECTLTKPPSSISEILPYSSQVLKCKSTISNVNSYIIPTSLPLSASANTINKPSTIDNFNLTQPALHSCTHIKTPDLLLNAVPNGYTHIQKCNSISTGKEYLIIPRLD